MVDLTPRPLRMTERDRSLFVNREADLEEATRTLLHGGNVLLLGDRGIGKTSFLYRVAERVREQGSNEAFVSGRIAETPVDLLYRVVDEVRDWPRSGREDHASTPELTLQLPVEEQQPRTSSNLLIDATRALRQALAGSAGVVFLDEPQAEIARTLFGRLRDELWELGLAWCVAVEVSSRGPLVSPPADAFWSKVIELEPLSDPDAALALARRGAADDLTPDVIRDLVQQARGNPRQLLQLASAATSGPESVAELRRAREELNAKLAGLSAPARRLYAELETMGATSPSDPELQARTSLSRGRLSQLLGELRDAGLVRSSSKRGGAGRPRTLFEVTA